MKPRRGSVLVEFALIALVLYIILAAILEFGRAIFAAQVLQQAADVAAREISRTPLPPTATLDQVLYSSDPEFAGVRRRIFNYDLLAIDLDQIPANTTLDDHIATFPIVNQQLRSVMIYETVDGRRLLHYPGVLPSDQSVPADEDETPGSSDPPDQGEPPRPIAMVSYENDTAEVIAHLPVIEEVKPSGGQGQFSLSSSSSLGGGLVALRINYPFQAVTLSGFRRLKSESDPFPPNGSRPIVADDVSAGTGDGAEEPGDAADGPDVVPSQTYSGPDSLGRHYALNQTLRPFRRLLSAQAIYRREIFK